MLSGGEEQVTMSALQLFQSSFLLFFKLTSKISGAIRQRTILFYFFPMDICWREENNSDSFFLNCVFHL